MFYISSPYVFIRRKHLPVSKKGEWKMNRRMSILLSILTFALICSFATAVYAQVQALSTGYAITSNYHGIDVPPGSSVVVTAMTTDQSVYQVTFLWKDPTGQEADREAVIPLFTNGTLYNGKLIHYAISENIVNTIGDWGVQALFQAHDGTTKQGITEVVKIRATSFNVIPEVPLIGTAGASIAMLSGLAYRMRKKNQK